MVQPLKHGKGRPLKIRIPTSFQCLGHTITVVKVPYEELKRMDREDTPDSQDEIFEGMYDHDNKVIYLNEELTYPKLEAAYIHEKTHCILEYMGEPELSDNEKFVELMTQIIYQIDKTSRGSIQTLTYRKGVRTPEGKAEFNRRKKQLKRKPNAQ